ncbi:MAG: glycosyltransferase family 4 protein [Clostridia bacterium]|nr:glycosyltransferase family 4 protein [Clostridia bacterium]
MKKILVFSSFPAPYRVDVFRHLARYYDMDVFFYYRKDSQRHADWYAKSGDGFTFYVLDQEPAQAKYRDCVKHLKQYDLVLVYDFTSSQAVKLQAQCVLHRIPYVINCDGAVDIRRSGWKAFVKTRLVRHAAKCLAGCERAKEYFLAYGAKEENIVLHNFTTLHEEQVLPHPLTPEQKSEIRRQYGLAEGKCVLAVGQFVVRKGFFTLIDAWAEAQPENATLYLIGGGPEEQAIRDRIGERGVRGIELLPFMPPEQVYTYMKAADLFVLLTVEDIWGLVIVEAMSAGIPVITTDRCTAGNELVVPGESGYIVPIQDAPAAAAALRTALADEGWLRRAGEVACRRVQHYTIEDVGESHHAVLEGVLQNRKK